MFSVTAGEGKARWLWLAAAAGGYGALFLAADQLGFSAHFWGISDQALRPVGHFVAYGMLAVVLARVLGGRCTLAWAVALLLAAAEEAHQAHVPTRVCSVGDWAVNAAGITCFSLAMPYARFWMAQRRYRRVLIAEGAWRPLTIRLPMRWALRRAIRALRQSQVRFKGAVAYCWSASPVLELPRQRRARLDAAA